MAAVHASDFGVLLRRHREAAGLSQEDLAERAGLATNAIGALERGERRRPYPRTVKVLADALGLDDAARRELIAAVPRPTRLAFLSGTTFVGRDAELAALRARFAEALAGRGAVAMLVGEAGIGKTRLAHEFAGAARQQGATVLFGRCAEGSEQAPYRPWVEAITEYVRTHEPASLRRDLGSGAASIGRLVTDVRTAVPDVPAPISLRADDERLRLHDAIAQLLLTVSTRKALVLCIDDLNWADADSLALLRHVARVLGRSRVLILGAYRDPELGLTADHPLMATLAALRREGEYEEVRLHGFSRDEVRTYLTETAGQTLAPGLIELIERETRGNPFYAREIFRHIAEEARVAPSADRATQLPSDALGIPEGVRQVVGQRIGRLSQRTGRVLRDAAGFGTGFTFAVLQQLTELPEGELLDCVDEALEAGMIRLADQEPPRYEFAHAIVRHAVYEGLSVERRVRLHRRIAATLELAYAGTEVEHAAELAAHYHASAHIPGAAPGVRHALAAAQQAAGAYAPERAAEFLRIARDLATESSAAEQAEIACKIAIAEAEALRLDDARRSADAALEALKAAGAAPRERAQFLVSVARALKDGGASPPVWEPLVERGVALVGDRRDLLWARLTLLRDNYAAIRSGPIGAGRWLEQDPEAVAIARTRGDESDYARTLEPLEWRAREQTDAVLTMVRGWSQPLAILRGLEVVVRDLLYRHGAFREARAVADELLAASQRFGSLSAEGEARAHTAVSQAAIGDLTLAQQSLAGAEEVVGRLGPSHRLHFTTTGTAIGIAYFLDGDWPHLAGAIARNATAADAVRRPVGTIASAYAALSLTRASAPVEAATWIRHVIDATTQEPATTWAHNLAVTVAAATIWELEATELASTCHDLLLDIARAGVGDAGVFGPLDLAIARMATLVGAVDEAQASFERACRKLDALGHMPLRAVAAYDHALALTRWGKADRPQASALFKSAEHEFRSLGMFGWAERAAGRIDTHGAARRDGTPTG